MDGFGKFKQGKPKGAKKKEMIKQEVRKVKKETEDYFKQKKKEYGRPKMENRQETPRGANQGTPGVVRETPNNDVMPLNKFLAHCGICSRREAVEKIKSGEVVVNGKTETNPAYKVQSNDVVKHNGKNIIPTRQLVYILLNKPKDFITTSEDDRGRKTVLDIVKTATQERIFPVGRLDRNTTGVLLLTNDGDLTQQLTHPSFEVRKIYEVTLDKPVEKGHLEQLIAGITLEDGPIHADAAGYADPKDKSVVGIEIHSGKNRVVRRMFEHLGYDVRALDRVMFANLTKKNVERGKWRFLTEKEIRLLKFFNKSKRKGKPGEVELQDTPFTGRGNKMPAKNSSPRKLGTTTKRNKR
jgi:23S rRNA pseudouridine2605 synthase